MSACCEFSFLAASKVSNVVIRLVSKGWHRSELPSCSLSVCVLVYVYVCGTNSTVSSCVITGQGTFVTPFSLSAAGCGCLCTVASVKYSGALITTPAEHLGGTVFSMFVLLRTNMNAPTHCPDPSFEMFSTSFGFVWTESSLTCILNFIERTGFGTY